MTLNELRKQFLEYFEQRKHTVVQSDLLIPSSDPTLLFTSAGMVQFKEYFMGNKSIKHNRAASCQKCFRTSDIDRIGHTARHLSFFEMLGNFSFGDYFKEDAINWGWEFLTKVAGIPAGKLYITVYKDDDEAFNLWKKIVPENRIYRLGDDTNFWTMGPTGPCGPCSEIIYDFGEEYKCSSPGCGPACDCSRWLEVWNLVFTQFDRQESGELKPLPRKNIDTGMGLERLTSVVNNLRNVFEIDAFADLIKEEIKIFNIPYPNGDPAINAAYRMISDHTRAVTFLIGDGILPSNEGRGYVLRRILRRAVRQGKFLKHESPFLHELASKQIDIVKDAYPELIQRRDNIVSIIKMEEQKFYETLNTGLSFLDELIKETVSRGIKVIPGKKIFELYDTYGFPPELSSEILQEQGLSYNKDEYDGIKQKSVELARHSWKGSSAESDIYKDEGFIDFIKQLQADKVHTEFTGYEFYETEAVIKGIYKNIAVLSKTPCYAEMGGQVADTGTLTINETHTEIVDTQSAAPGITVHMLSRLIPGMETGAKAVVKVDIHRRKSIMRNHTATHLLHKALHEVLGPHAVQSGSLVTPDRLRFDFSHLKALELSEIELIENKVYDKIIACLPVRTVITGQAAARSMGATALFGEKYGDKVRCVITGGIEGDTSSAYSIELCGGTHVRNTGEIGYFKIVAEASIGSGLRRIEAITGTPAMLSARDNYKLLKEIEYKLKTNEPELSGRIDSLLQKQKQLEKEISGLKTKLATGAGQNREEYSFKDAKLIVHELDNADPKELRVISDKIREKETGAVILVFNKTESKLSFVMTLTKDLAGKMDCRELGSKLCPLLDGGSCGGRQDFVQGGAKSSSGLSDVIKKFILI